MNSEFLTKFKIKDLSILEFNHWIVSVRPAQVTVGSLVISLKRICPELNQLTDEETKELALVFNKTETLLQSALGYNKINYLALMMVDEQIHFHVIPRYENPLVFESKEYPDTDWPGPVVIQNTIDEADISERVFTFLKKEVQKSKLVVGYTTGVFDLFHIGHLNILKRAKEHCDYLIVGVTTDELVSYKNTKAIIPFEERAQIIEGISYVDKVVPQSSMDKMEAWHRLKFDRMFVGDDWKGTEKWNQFEEDFAKVNVEIVYFPYTKGTSSTQLKKVLSDIIEKNQ